MAAFFCTTEGHGIGHHPSKESYECLKMVHKTRRRKRRRIIDVNAVIVMVTVAEESKACTVFCRSKTVIVASSSTWSIDAWMLYLCICTFLCRRSFATVVSSSKEWCKMSLK
jgi:hypothetical protein